MLIDWFTVGAQVLNFIVLVWLMKRYLYKPILVAVDTREKRIADDLASAASREADAQEQRDLLQHENEELAAQRTALLEEATDAAAEEGRHLLEEARRDADALRSKRHESLMVEARNLNVAVRHRAEQEVLAIARRVLTDLSTVTLEASISEVFARRVREMDDQAKATVVAALEGTNEPALVRSAFDLPSGQRAAIQSAIDDTFALAGELRFETAPDLVSGIELAVNGQKVSWSVADYLASLEKGVGELVSASAGGER